MVVTNVSTVNWYIESAVCFEASINLYVQTFLQMSGRISFSRAAVAVAGGMSQPLNAAPACSDLGIEVTHGLSIMSRGTRHGHTGWLALGCMGTRAGVLVFLQSLLLTGLRTRAVL